MHRDKTCSDIPTIVAYKSAYSSNKFPSPTNFLKNKFVLTIKSQIKNKISIRDPSLWNKVLSSTEKELQEPSLLKVKLKSKLLKMNVELKYF